MYWLYEGCVHLLALLFLFTATNKILDWHHFIRQMNNQVFSKPLSAVLIVAVPFLEFLAVFLLMRVKTRMLGLRLSLVLMTAFTMYIGLIILQVFPRVPCSCAGVFNQMSWHQHFLFNIAFTTLAAAGIFIKVKLEKTSTEVLTL